MSDLTFNQYQNRSKRGIAASVKGTPAIILFQGLSLVSDWTGRDKHYRGLTSIVIYEKSLPTSTQSNL